ncbi:Protein of unknown function [Pyronema omphalodes CBS 100304]|uniref:Uncharacterized protein n=1 Tax=Pyronema omphalodes (strain CBS 100304) TaxID=1076935 RepID=U4LUV1_PYROM|nr:Protein of unknown function [Pyronema omphalodes CBS 100304]
MSSATDLKHPQSSAKASVRVVLDLRLKTSAFLVRYRQPNFPFLELCSSKKLTYPHGRTSTTRQFLSIRNPQS